MWSQLFLLTIDWGTESVDEPELSGGSLAIAPNPVVGIGKQEQRIPIGFLTSGTYLLRATTGNGVRMG